MVPGCLTGESEERETWTAESLRAAILERDWLRERPVASEIRPDETSAVDVSGQHPCRKAAGACGASRTGLCACEQEWDLVKVARRELRYARNVVISREKFSSNLRV